MNQAIEDNEKYIQELKKLKELQIKNEENIKTLSFESNF